MARAQHRLGARALFSRLAGCQALVWFWARNGRHLLRHFGLCAVVLLNVLPSSVFRRGLRLFLPTIVATLVFATLVQTSWFEMARPYNDPYIHPEASFLLEMGKAYRVIRAMTDVWTFQIAIPDYDWNLCKSIFGRRCSRGY